MRLVLWMVGVIVIAMAAGAAGADPIPLWPNGVPGDGSAGGDEKDMTTAKDSLVAGRSVIRLGNVATPTITLFRPPQEKDTGAAVVVFPGGGYRILAMDLEGTEICQWLNSIGVTGVLLKYRVPARPGQPPFAAPLQDAQRAVSMVRRYAKEWGLKADRIGVLGFSAGGHLAASASANFETRTYPAADSADEVSCRPDFAVLVYPAYLTVANQGNAIASDLKVTARVPPSFFVQTEDDPVRVENSVYYYAALKKAGVPAEMHLFATGGHGYGLRPTEKPVTGWPQLAEQWMRGLGVLTR